MSQSTQLFDGLSLVGDERRPRRQGWLEKGKDVKKDPELEPEVLAHAREPVENILDDISAIEERQSLRLTAKIRRNIAKASRRQASVA